MDRPTRTERRHACFNRMHCFVDLFAWNFGMVTSFLKCTSPLPCTCASLHLAARQYHTFLAISETLKITTRALDFVQNAEQRGLAFKQRADLFCMTIALDMQYNQTTETGFEYFYNVRESVALLRVLDVYRRGRLKPVSEYVKILDSLLLKW